MLCFPFLSRPLFAACLLAMLLLTAAPPLTGQVRDESALSSVASRTGGDKLLIALLPESQAPLGVVHLKDIAQIHGSDAGLGEVVSGLDVGELTAERSREKVSRETIDIRLRLAGLSPRDYILSGAAEAGVSAATFTWDDASVLHELRQPLAQRLAVDGGELEVRLTRPLTPLPPAIIANPRLTILPQLPDTVRAGPLNVRVGIYEDQQLVYTALVAIDARIFRDVYVATRPLPRGATLSEANVAKQRLPLNAQISAQAAAETLGRLTSSTLATGDIVLTRHLAQPHPSTAADPYLIRARDTITVIASRGSLRVTLHDAEAMEQGRLGDTIRVRNPRSRQILRGKVVGASQVSVFF